MFVHTFLDLIDSDLLPTGKWSKSLEFEGERTYECRFLDIARDFFMRSAAYHDALHHADLIQLKNVSSSAHLLVNPLVGRFRQVARFIAGLALSDISTRRNKYTVNLSRGSFGLLIGWLSDLGLEAIWDVSKDASRYKEAVRTITNQRLKLKGQSISSWNITS